MLYPYAGYCGAGRTELTAEVQGYGYEFRAADLTEVRDMGMGCCTAELSEEVSGYG